MTRTIWKFPFEIRDRVTINMPRDAQILHVGLQDGTPTLWALVDPDSSATDRIFYVFGTGHQIAHVALEHVGTLLMPPFVWHIFETGDIEKLQAEVLEHDRICRGESNTKSTGRV